MKQFGLLVINYGLFVRKMIYCVVTMRYQMNQVVAIVLWKLRDYKPPHTKTATEKGDKQMEKFAVLLGHVVGLGLIRFDQVYAGEMSLFSLFGSVMEIFAIAGTCLIVGKMMGFKLP
jgi:hypothetical protein